MKITNLFYNSVSNGAYFWGGIRTISICKQLYVVICHQCTSKGPLYLYNRRLAAESSIYLDSSTSITWKNPTCSTPRRAESHTSNPPAKEASSCHSFPDEYSNIQTHQADRWPFQGQERIQMTAIQGYNDGHCMTRRHFTNYPFRTSSQISRIMFPV